MEILSWLVVLGLFAIGTAIGSFLNCVIWRLHKNESFVSGRSYCPKCRHRLSWRDLVPLLSFLDLSGKCRYCRKPISWQYPAVEFATGLLFAAIGWFLVPQTVIYFNFSPVFVIRFLYYAALISLLVVIFVFDLRWYLIPDETVFFGVGWAAAYRLFEFAYSAIHSRAGDASILTDPLLAAASAGAFFFALFFISRGKWMGFGDVKYAFFMGLVLGFPQIAVGLFFAFLLGAIIGLGLIFLKKKTMSSQIPFGPFLVAGTLVAIFFSQPILDWYFSFAF